MTAPLGTGRALGAAMSVMEFDQISMTGTGSKAAFFGVTPIVQPSGANQAALTLTTGSTGGVGFTTTTNFSAFVAQVQEIRNVLVNLGLMKGSA